MIQIQYFYSPENESEVNLEVWRFLENRSEELRQIYYEHTGNQFEVQLTKVTEDDRKELPEQVRELITKDREALPILVVDGKIYKYGIFSITEAVEDILAIAVSIQIEED
ncbi:hypothetical protein [Listeria costaricensis]|uniref:hypothetical protein n=1 Tax=Listeria costaricensis TaxID=2026604 RepID=UPI000C08AEA1|nr:hypothetical protein [Listeria costaricensis]